MLPLVSPTFHRERGFTAKERANVLGAVYLAAAVCRDDADEIIEWTSSFDLSGNTLPDNEEADAHKIRRIIHKARSWAVEGGTDEWQHPELHPVDYSERTYADDGNSAYVCAMRSMCASADCADDEVHDDDRLQTSYLVDVSRVCKDDDEHVLLYFSDADGAVASAEKCNTVTAIRAPTPIAPVSACANVRMRQYVTLMNFIGMRPLGERQKNAQQAACSDTGKQSSSTAEVDTVWEEDDSPKDVAQNPVVGQHLMNLSEMRPLGERQENAQQAACGDTGYQSSFPPEADEYWGDENDKTFYHVF